jgi:hypothetical protein
MMRFPISRLRTDFERGAIPSYQFALAPALHGRFFVERAKIEG